MHKYVLLLLLFIYVFDVPINMGENMIYGAVIVGLVCTILLFCKKKYQGKYLAMLLSRYHIYILLLIIVVAVYSAIVVLLNDTGDYSYLRVCVHMIVNIEVGVLLFGLIKAYGKEDKVIDYIIDVFIIQAIIQILSFVSPDFKLITDIFRSSTQLEYAKLYAGYRGLGVAGSGFFGLAIVYGFLFVLIAYYWREWNVKSIIMRTLYLIILGLGAVSAGRSALFGIFFAFLYLTLMGGSRFIGNSYRIVIGMGNWKTILVMFFLILIGVSMYINLAETTNPSLRGFYHFISSFLEGIFNDKGLYSSTSGQSLFDSLKYELDYKQFLFGDGRYAGIDGAANYMHQDSGYMRNLLLFGIGGSFLLFCIQYFMWKPCFLNNTEEKVFAAVICLMAMVFHIKGEVVGISIEYQSLSLMVCYALTAVRPY